MTTTRLQESLQLSLAVLTIAVIACTQLVSAQTETAAPAQPNFLLSVAFKTNNPAGNSPPMSGAEPSATLAYARFGAAKVWNNLQNPYAPPLVKNPKWTNLLNSRGAVTGVSLAITGTVLPVDLYPYFTNVDPLRSAFMAWNSWTNGGGGAGPGESKTITWKLTGLPASAAFDMCVYGSDADIDRGFNMTIQGVVMNIPTFNDANSPLPNCVLFSNIVSDSNGTISGIAAGVGESLDAKHEANWSGFQLIQIATPVSGTQRTGFWRVTN
jgi:hypothetical protein